MGRDAARFLGCPERANRRGREALLGLPSCDKTPFENRVMAQGQFRIARGIQQECQCQLRRSAAAVTPRKAGRAVVADFERQRQEAQGERLAPTFGGWLEHLHPDFGAVATTASAVSFLGDAWRAENGEVGGRRRFTSRCSLL